VVERSADWLRQAERDLRQAHLSVGEGLHEWACFAAQQAAEKAVKALAQALGAAAWGHSVLQIVEGLRAVVDLEEPVSEDAAILDQLYIPPRYPNGFAAGAPGDYYTETQAEDAIERAGRIVELVRGRLARP